MVKKVASYFHKPNSLTGASILLIVTLFLSNILGWLRDHYLTQKIPTDILSSYYAAFRIPDLIFNILILGAITSAFIPVFTGLVTTKKNEEAWRVTNSVINLAILTLIVICGILFVFMPIIVPKYVPGFDLNHQLITIRLARIMLGSPLLFGLSYIFGGILNSYKRFFAYAIAPLIYNLTIILGTILFSDKFGITAVAIAVVCGAFLHFLIQLPVAIKLGFKFQPIIDLSHQGVRKIGILMLPRAIALGANQIMLTLFTMIASSIGGYAVAVYTLADNIQTMPLVVFGTSFATAVFPSLSESWAAGNSDKFSEHIKKMMKVIIFFMVPLSAMLILLRMQIVRLLFGSGHFGWEQTMETGNTLGFFALSLIFSGLIPLFSRAFYAKHNTRIPMIVNTVSAIISVIAGKILANSFGVEGLALGFSIGSLINALALYIILGLRTKLDTKAMLIFTLKVVIAGLITALAVEEIKYAASFFVDMQRFWGVAVQLLLAGFGGVGVYLICCWILGCEEIWGIKTIMQRFTRRENGFGYKEGETDPEVV